MKLLQSNRKMSGKLKSGRTTATTYADSVSSLLTLVVVLDSFASCYPLDLLDLDLSLA
jgi:hypothetical protein